MNPLRSPFLFVLTTVSAATAVAQDWYFEPQNAPPPARRFHALAHVGGAEVLFGGVHEPSGLVHGDTWRYDGVAWTPLPIAGPGARQRFASCVDPVQDVLLVFGGADANGQPLGDTWRFDGAAWQLVPTAHAPSARLGAAMAFDALRGRAVLFGGGSDADTPTAETWEFDGVDWTQRVATNAPAARQGHAMAFDTARGVSLLFGGFAPGQGGFTADTWQWDGTTWAPVNGSVQPPALAFPSLAFFEPHGVAVLTGGNGAASQLLATWIHDGTAWQPGPPAPAGLTSRQGHATTYDRQREMVVLFGGARIALGGAVPDAQTWELAVRADFVPTGSGCAFAGGVPVLDTVGGARPQLGTALPLRVAPAGDLALFVAGSSDLDYLGQPLPLELTALGLPGCHLATSIEWSTFVVPVGGAATTTIDVPLQRALLGTTFFVQALAIDGGAVVPGAVSNAARATIGN
ncbi:MAG: hypothetical protein JNL08_00095 [Planctomycetes bacterium]|nr:hypothetical protein [Planctomycetota bacterium]